MDSGVIITIVTFGITVTGFLVAWLVKIEKNNMGNIESTRNISRIERELGEMQEDFKDIDKRLRSTEVALSEIKADTRNINRNVEAIFTILDHRRRDEDLRR